MAKYQTEEELIQIINDYYDNNDAAGLVGFFIREQERIDEEFKAGEREDDFKDSMFHKIFVDSLESLCASDETDQNDFAKNVAREAARHTRVVALDTSIIYEDTVQQLKNGEIEGMELLAEEEKYLDIMSPGFAQVMNSSGQLKRDNNVQIATYVTFTEARLGLDIMDGVAEYGNIGGQRGKKITRNWMMRQKRNMEICLQRFRRLRLKSRLH